MSTMDYKEFLKEWKEQKYGDMPALYPDANKKKVKAGLKMSVEQIARLPKGKFHFHVADKLEEKKILEYDKNGKPKLNLTLLEKTAVHTPTPEDYDTLLQVYECGGWRWAGKTFPTSYLNWKYEDKTCIDVGVSYLAKRKGEFGFAGINFYNKEKCKIISLQEFYNIQKITPQMIKEINDWFEKYKPNRVSKGE